MQDPRSESAKTWQRFRRNRPAVAGAVFIVLAALTAVFGYWLAPDDSPDANFQITEIALREPGFRAVFLRVPLNRAVPKADFFEKSWHGQAPAHRLVPIEKAELRGDSVHFERIGSRGKIEKLHLAQVFLPLRDSVWAENGTYRFISPDGSQQAADRADLAARFERGAAFSTRTFQLGTDKYGRCILSRLLLGFRISLLVGLIAVAISLLIGVTVGLLGGYFGGRMDDLAVLLINTVWSIPTLLLVFAIVLALGRGIGIVFLAVGLTMWVDVARVVRGQALALREMPFVEAARSMGLGPGRVLWRHVLPNLLGPVMVVAAGNFATAILVESGLGYLGFGVQPPAPSWGSMLNENYGYALGGKPLLALAPALAIMLSVLAFNLLGNGLRDALDVRAT